MTAKTFYPLSTKFSGVEHLEMQDGGIAPGTATTSTGWTVGTIAAGNFSRMDSATERSTGTFGTTVQPSSAPNNTLGDCFVAGPYTGQFAAGNWTFTFPVIAVSRAGASGRLRLRIWRSTSSSGSGATQITASTAVGTVVSGLDTSTPQSSVITVNPGLFTLANEYLFIQLAWEITTGLILFSDYDVLLRVGSAATIATTDFAAGQTLAGTMTTVSTFTASLLNIAPFAGSMTTVSTFTATLSSVLAPPSDTTYLTAAPFESQMGSEPANTVLVAESLTTGV